MSAIIETKNAISTGTRVLVKNIDKYIVSENCTKGFTNQTLITFYYRRFTRLKSYISQRQMIRDTYMNYIKYKFKYEDYEKKRHLILGDKITSNQLNLKEQLSRTYNFLFTAVSYIEKDNASTNKDILMAKQIFKNILTVEYFKTENNEKVNNDDYYQYRMAFRQLGKKHTNSGNNKDISIGEFDKLVTYLNETLGTRL
ncbi:sporulation protein [Maudiozyma exigua]|uniref:Sporulation protein n=1 Tax=Maudiozyma exigua TaxID=34358 RepID=A0A9P6WB22_MAUEX|nr:sporulation protein [Kazachstania exigua]